MRTSVKYAVIYRHKEKYSISEMCRFFEISRSGYYGYVARMNIPAKDLYIANKIQECQEKCGKTVYARLTCFVTLQRFHAICCRKNSARKTQQFFILQAIQKFHKYSSVLPFYSAKYNKSSKNFRPNIPAPYIIPH